MLAGANLVVVARSDDGHLIGIARSITDGAYSTYLGDLAVHVAYQGQGVGRETPGDSAWAQGGGRCLARSLGSVQRRGFHGGKQGKAGCDRGP
ncbi:GNAT family N-acetyltransferase [Streptomyces sp. NPDC054840]